MSGKLRIIGGRWRGRKLPVPDLPGLRPSGDRAREVLFNWLQGYVQGAHCLDLFAGTGALGLEAASRGAAGVVLVEHDRQLCEQLKAAGRDWPGGDCLQTVQADGPRWLEHARGPFDIVFVDPPFDAGLHGRVLDALARPGLLADGARVYIESPARAPAPVTAPAPEPASSPCMLAWLNPPTWRIERDKRVGEVRMQLLARERPADESALPGA